MKSIIKINIYYIFLVLAGLLFSAQSIRVDSNNSLFVDQYNRYTIYHGVNAVYKTFPFHPNLVEFSTNYSLTDHDLLNLKNWGMNSIRLHAAWEGI
jgi:endoglycosylceramidase